MRHARYIGIRRLKGGKIAKLSNVEKLEKDFAKSVSFGKTDQSTLSPAEIKKKFSI